MWTYFLRKVGVDSLVPGYIYSFQITKNVFCGGCFRRVVLFDPSEF